MNLQVLVMATTPVPGRVKTRLCPPCTPAQAAEVAAAALADTLDAVTAAPVRRRVLVVDGDLPAPAGWHRVVQRGVGLGARLATAFADTGRPGLASLLVGMDTPQLRAPLHAAAALLGPADAPPGPADAPPGPADAVFGPAEDGGWWALGLRDPAHAEVLRHIVTSTPTTGAETLAALRGRGLRVAMLPRLRDVDTAADAHTVATLCDPASRFATAVAAHVPAGVRV
jgi:hypothetical protein